MKQTHKQKHTFSWTGAGVQISSRVLCLPWIRF
jgi:hypothetical protein